MTELIIFLFLVLVGFVWWNIQLHNNVVDANNNIEVLKDIFRHPDRLHEFSTEHGFTDRMICLNTLISRCSDSNFREHIFRINQNFREHNVRINQNENLLHALIKHLNLQHKYVVPTEVNKIVFSKIKEVNKK